MTKEKERYTGLVIRRAKNSLTAEAVVSAAMISAALLLLEAMI